MTELQALKLKARRGDKILFSNLSFTVKTGQIISVSGANGSGKSTLLRLLAGLYPPFDGRITLKAAPTEKTPSQPLPRSVFSHYLSDKNAMKPQLTVWRNLQFWYRFLNAGNAAANRTEKTDIERALDAVKMANYADLPFAVLSTGQKRRIGFCRFILAPRPLWLLDEPTSGLDNTSTNLFTALCNRHLQTGGLIITATHLPLDLALSRNINLADYKPKTQQEQFYDSLNFNAINADI